MIHNNQLLWGDGYLAALAHQSSKILNGKFSTSKINHDELLLWIHTRTNPIAKCALSCRCDKNLMKTSRIIFPLLIGLADQTHRSILLFILEWPDKLAHQIFIKTHGVVLTLMFPSMYTYTIAMVIITVHSLMTDQLLSPSAFIILPTNFHQNQELFYQILPTKLMSICPVSSTQCISRVH